jgi:hypothetical protein
VGVFKEKEKRKRASGATKVYHPSNTVYHPKTFLATLHDNTGLQSKAMVVGESVPTPTPTPPSLRLSISRHSFSSVLPRSGSWWKNTSNDTLRLRAESRGESREQRREQRAENREKGA